MKRGIALGTLGFSGLGLGLALLMGADSAPRGEVELAKALRRDVTTLATRFPERNTANHAQLLEAQAWVTKKLGVRHPDKVSTQVYEVGGQSCANIELILTGTEKPKEIVVVGAHYDSVPGSPAANDNASGTAALLHLARHFSGRQTPKRTLRLVAFVNEEPPHFQRESMGSLVYSKRCQAREENVHAMLSLETLGYYTDAPKSQNYPPLIAAFYPKEGNFLALVANPSSKWLVNWMKERFETHSDLPVESAALPPALPGIGWSDHWSFWQAGYPAVMATDTAHMRYPHYHKSTDTPDKLDYSRFAKAVQGLCGVVEDLVDSAGASRKKRR